MKLRAVGFDLWETLVTNSPEATELQRVLRTARVAETLAAHRQQVPPELVDAAYRRTWEQCHELYWSRDLDVPTRRQIEILLAALELTSTHELAEALERAYAEAILDHLPAVVEGAREALEWCRSRSLRVGLVSNTGRTPGSVLRTVLQRLGLEERIDVMVFSNEVGACKPSEKIFGRLLEDLGTEPVETVFVGDNLEADVAGAQLLGMRGVHFDPPVKGTAFAPHGGRHPEQVPWAKVTSLGDLPRILEERLG